MMRNVLMKTTVTALFLYHQNATCHVKIVKKSTYTSIRTFLVVLSSLTTMFKAGVNKKPKKFKTLAWILGNFKTVWQG